MLAVQWLGQVTCNPADPTRGLTCARRPLAASPEPPLIGAGAATTVLASLGWEEELGHVLAADAAVEARASQADASSAAGTRSEGRDASTVSPAAVKSAVASVAAARAPCVRVRVAFAVVGTLCGPAAVPWADAALSAMGEGICGVLEEAASAVGAGWSCSCSCLVRCLER